MPDLSNILASLSAKEPDEVHKIMIRVGGPPSVSGHKHLRPYAWETFLADLPYVTSVYERGELKDVEWLSGGEAYEFPEPLGPQAVYHFAHEETKTLPKFLGKSVDYVDFKLAINDDFVRAVLALSKLRYLSYERKVTTGSMSIPAQELFLLMLPRPTLDWTEVQGHQYLCVDVTGRQGGKWHMIKRWIGLDQKESFRTCGSTAYDYLASLMTACGVSLLAKNRLGLPGVYAAESLEPTPFLEFLKTRGIEVHSRRFHEV